MKAGTCDISHMICNVYARAVTFNFSFNVSVAMVLRSTRRILGTVMEDCKIPESTPSTVAVICTLKTFVNC